MAWPWWLALDVALLSLKAWASSAGKPPAHGHIWSDVTDTAEAWDSVSCLSHFKKPFYFTTSSIFKATSFSKRPSSRKAWLKNCLVAVILLSETVTPVRVGLPQLFLGSWIQITMPDIEAQKLFIVLSDVLQNCIFLVNFLLCHSGEFYSAT